MVLADFPWQIFMSPFGIPIAAIIGVFAWLTFASISEAVAKVMCNRDESELKLELLARGFTAEQIVSVVEAGRAGESAMKEHHRHVQTPRHAAST